MLYKRESNTRGNVSLSWLESKHSFSFGHYYDPAHMGFSVLRVINDDTVAAGAGFETHPHRDMEIISYVLEGAVEHKDSEGNSYVVPAGDVQLMSAGSGIRHSEFNHSHSQPLKFLQIWIQPNQRGIKPSYQQKNIIQHGRLTPLVTPDGRDSSLKIHHNACLYRLHLEAGDTIELSTDRHAGYLHIIEGSLDYSSDQDDLNNLSGGDGLGLQDELVSFQAGNKGATALWFELPKIELTAS